MKYINADIILPEELLKEVQKYVQGGMVYIPKPEGLRKKWGENSGSRVYLKKRNLEIRRLFASGATIDQLSSQFCLSCDSIKKIVYTKNK
ncbi:CD3324 family protein [Paenibacillus lautus]|uniref:CD3324 family protein n=1 Tax=Paenibacillus lautus TaxID=1401 RepID=UPI000FD8576D|nr:CD3324 family protein [Paenibacillus lautus]